jgi:hypothetical protein
MDLPPCPVCGEELHLESDHGPAKCGSCGFVTPVETDKAAFGDILREAQERGLGQRPLLSASHEAPELPMSKKQPPSMLEDPRAPELPTLSPPPAPPELAERAPSRLEDPRSSLEPASGKAPETPLGRDVEERKEQKDRRLRARGELLR